MADLLDPKDYEDKEVDRFIGDMAKAWLDNLDALWLLQGDGDWKDIESFLKAKNAKDVDAATKTVTGHLQAAFKADTKALGGAKFTRAWMVARVNELQFLQKKWKRGGGHWPSFKPAKAFARDTTDIPTDISESKPKYNKIAPGLAKFLSAVKDDFGPFTATNRKGHTTVGVLDQGLSVDCYVTKKTKDGFWFDVDQGVDFLTSVDKVALSSDYKGTKWLVLYNHFALADKVNGKLKQGVVRFRGGGATYHGPNPAILHFHLEVVVPSDAPVPKS
jgi:hypothetical protein